MEKHTIEPFYNKNSKILILGTFPSIKSREVGFYYSHPQNRFWKVLANTFKEDVPDTISLKKKLLLRHKIALFDICQACEINASSDASIKSVIPNDLDPIFKIAQIKVVAFDGNKAYQLYLKYFRDKYNVELLCLPSTSPANAKFKLEDLINAYQVLSKY